VSYRNVAAAISMAIFSFYVLVPGGGAAVLPGFDADAIERTDLSIEPDIPDSEYTDVALSDYYDKENVTVVDRDTTNATYYDSEKVVVLENGSTSGSITYRARQVDSVRTISTPYTLFEGSRMELCDDGGCVSIEAEFYSDLSDTADYFTINFLNGTQAEPVLYSVSTSNVPPAGPIETLIAYATAFGSFPVQLFQLFLAFPLYIQAYFGAIFAYMIKEFIPTL